MVTLPTGPSRVRGVVRNVASAVLSPLVESVSSKQKEYYIPLKGVIASLIISGIEDPDKSLGRD